MKKHPPPNPAKTRHGGFTLLGLLFLVAGLGVALAAAGTAWHTAAKREKEAELLFIGQQYRQALASYRERTPGAIKLYPKRLVDLLTDPRYLTTQRHLRRLQADPITGGDWVLVRDSVGGISGVHSASQTAPLKTAGFSPENAAFEGAKRYADWVFTPR